jgi:hypothetical protein
MSAISDALRRASAAQSEGASLPLMPVSGDVPPVVPSAVPELLIPQDGEGDSDENSGKKFSPLLTVICVLFAIGAGAGFFLWKGGGRTERVLAKENSTSKIVAAAKTLEASNSASAPAKPAPKQPAAEPVTTAPIRQEVAPTPVPAPVVTPTKLAPPKIPVAFPPLRLQGIYYKPSNPSVVINGRMLYLNDEIQGVTVAGIDSSSVTLVLSGQTNVLTLR